jgi:DNA-binding response OmpR family regulator
MNPRLLLLEDDPVSAAFLVQALATMPVVVDLAGSLASARRLARGGHALWLFDAQLPDGHAGSLLAELRADGLRTPALALTAADDAPALARLHEAGFADVLGKPITAHRLRELVCQHLPTVNAHSPWDDDAARAALGGDLASVSALRTLFLDELSAQGPRLRASLASGELAAAREQLHRLKASCGFVGALALLGAVRELSNNLLDHDALDRFERFAGHLLVASGRPTLSSDAQAPKAVPTT